MNCQRIAAAAAQMLGDITQGDPEENISRLSDDGLAAAEFSVAAYDAGRTVMLKLDDGSMFEMRVRQLMTPTAAIENGMRGILARVMPSQEDKHTQ